MTTKKLSVAVLMGGDSSERSVSFSSGRAVADALQSAGYAVTCFDVSSQGYRGDVARSDAMGRRPRHAIFPVTWDHLVTALYTNGFDAIFPVLHGGRGEDGTLQTLLEVGELPFVGSPARACCIAIEKPLCKVYLSGFGIKSPRGVFVSSVEELEGVEIAFPCVVKPAGGGSSVGVSILHEGTPEALQTAVAKALIDGSGALIEDFIEGMETTCVVMGEGESAKALPVIEIESKKGEGFYDFEAKYAAGGSDHIIPARLPQETLNEIQTLAEQVHRTLGCRGVTRSDFLVKANGEVFFLECNTTPGMTETSLVPDAAKAIGVDFPALVTQLVQSAQLTK
jgi:D-alanine-D-alanine ligase